jgi:uncharacterized protein YfeS
MEMQTNESAREDMEAFLDRYKMFSDLMLERVKESEYIPPNRRLCEEDRIALYGIYVNNTRQS